MIKLIPRNKINDQQWNSLLEKIPGNNVYSLSWYMDALAENWMIASDEKMNNVMLLPFKVKAGVKLTYQPFFSREVACHLDENHLPSDVIHLLKKDFRQVEFALNDVRGIDAKKFKTQKWQHQYLNLQDSYKNIFQNYSDNAKRLIKKAQNAELRIVSSIDFNSVIQLFKKSKGDELKEIKKEDYEKLKKLMSIGLKNKIGKCYHVLNSDNDLLAAGYFFEWNGYLIYLKGSASEKGKKLGAMYFMFDQLIHQKCGTLNELDFGGSKVPSVANFYKKFGATDREYYFIKHQNLPLYFKLMKSARKVLGR